MTVRSKHWQYHLLHFVPSPLLPSSEASQRLLLLLVVLVMKKPFPRGVHAWGSHACPHGNAAATIRGTRQLTPH